MLLHKNKRFAQEYTAKTGKELQVDDGTAIGRGLERGAWLRLKPV
jgi:hypothetical protein